MSLSEIYRLLCRVFPVRQPPADVQRIVVVLPCCIGDVVMGTAILPALRQLYPRAHITWAVGDWSHAALMGHPLLDELLNLGAGAFPSDWGAFVRQLRAGHYDLAVSLSRSPRIGAALWAAGIPYRAGLNSDGRGFGYNIRADIRPQDVAHEVDIYLRVGAALGADVRACLPSIPIDEQATTDALNLLALHGVTGRFLVVNPSGGTNPGATLGSKRYPPPQLAYMVNLLASVVGVSHVLIVAAPQDAALAEAVRAELWRLGVVVFAGALTFPQVAGLALLSVGYIGNDTGLTHYVAAAGIPTAMMMGPTSPARYRPYAPNGLALWKAFDVPNEGVSAALPTRFDWERHGVSPSDAAPWLIRFFGEGLPDMPHSGGIITF